MPLVLSVFGSKTGHRRETQDVRFGPPQQLLPRQISAWQPHKLISTRRGLVVSEPTSVLDQLNSFQFLLTTIIV